MNSKNLYTDSTTAKRKQNIISNRLNQHPKTDKMHQLIQCELHV